MDYNIPKLNNIKNKIQKYGYLIEDKYNDDAFADLKCKYSLRFDKTYLLNLEIKNTEWRIELINSHKRECYEIKVSQITDEIMESVRKTDERHGMCYQYDSDEIFLMIEEHFVAANEKTMYRDKIINSFRMTLDRLIPEIFINGYMNARFQMSYNNMTQEEKSSFQKETDEYRRVRNQWELKKLCRKLDYLSDNKKLLDFVPEEKTLVLMGYDNLNELRDDLCESEYFIMKNRKLNKSLKYKICIFVENGQMYLKTESFM